jgi:hypothetical protein
MFFRRGPNALLTSRVVVVVVVVVLVFNFMKD